MKADPKAGQLAKQAFELGRSNAVFRFSPLFRRGADGVYEARRQTWAGKVSWVDVEDPTEAIAYLKGYEEGIQCRNL